jgi:hypothetical protein
LEVPSLPDTIEGTIGEIPEDYLKSLDPEVPELDDDNTVVI